MIIGIIYQTWILEFQNIRIRYLINIRISMAKVNCSKLKKELEAAAAEAAKAAAAEAAAGAKK